MRTHQEMMAEIELRKALGLPRIELTPQERARAFGDAEWPERDLDSYDKMLAQRLTDGLPMSQADKRRARQFMRASA